MTMTEAAALNRKVIRFRHEGNTFVGQVVVQGEGIFTHVRFNCIEPAAFHVTPLRHKVNEVLAGFAFLEVVAETPTPEMKFHC